MQINVANSKSITYNDKVVLATIESNRKNSFEHVLASADALKATRSTAVNLEWAVNKQLNATAQGKTAYGQFSNDTVQFRILSNRMRCTD